MSQEDGDRLEDGSIGLAPMHATPLRDRVYDHLRDQILSGRRKRSERIVIADLAADLGVSATPVRDALRALEEDGLVESSPRRWTRVAPPNAELAGELYPIIAALEVLAVRSIRAADDDLLAALEQANERFCEAVAEQDPSACLAANDAFHARLVAAVGNGALTKTLEDLKTRVQMLDSEYFDVNWRHSVDEHALIVAALRDDDRDRAAEIMHRHWMRWLPRWGEGPD